MTKSIFVATVIALLNLAICSLWAQDTTKDYKVNDFSSIELQSVGDIIFTQSTNYSCRIEGWAEYIEKMDVTVKDKKIIIGYKQKITNNKVKNLKIYISAPDLTKVEIDGVGNFNANEKLNLKNVSFELDGVGNCDVQDLRCDAVKVNVDGVGNIKLNVNCHTINAKVDGVGNITLSGKADKATIERGGVGRINYKNLDCSNIVK